MFNQSIIIMYRYLKSFRTSSFLAMLSACMIIGSCSSPGANHDPQKETTTQDSTGFVPLFDGATLKVGKATLQCGM